MSEDYVREKLADAVDVLATSTEPIQVRLRDAYLAMVMLSEDDFVDEPSRAEFVELTDKINAVAAVGEEGTLQATTSQMGDHEAQELARLIVGLDAHYRPRWLLAGKSITDTG